MMTMTMGEIAFYETRMKWEKNTIPERRANLRVIAEDEVHAESHFHSLPASIRDSLIQDWQRQHLERRI